MRHDENMKVLDLLKFVTREEADMQRLYLTEEEFEPIEFGLKYFCTDHILVFKLKKSLMDVNITSAIRGPDNETKYSANAYITSTREEYDVQVNAMKANIMNNEINDKQT